MKRLLVVALVVLLFLPSECAAADTSSPELKPVLLKVKKRLDQWLDAINDDLRTSAERLSRVDFKSDQARAELKNLLIGRTYIIDAIIMDEKGKSIVIQSSQNKPFNEKDVFAQENAADVEVTKKPEMSCQFRTGENLHAIVFEYPIFDDGTYRGSVSLLVDQEDLLSTIIKPIIRDVPCKIWMMQPDGLIVYTEYTELLNRNIFSAEELKSMKGLLGFAKTAAARENGVGSYEDLESLIGGDSKQVVRKHALWDTVELYGTKWRVCVVKED